jgi:hypothetical protein
VNAISPVTYALGPISVQVRTDIPAVRDHLDEFYATTSRLVPPSAWTIEATESLPHNSTPDRWGVWRRLDARHRLLRLASSNHQNLAVSARKCLRETFLDHCERRRYAMLHASAVATDDHLVIVVGDKGSGKTTLALRAVLDHGWRYISNDHLILYPSDLSGLDRSAEPGGLVITSLPTPIPVKIGTYLDLEDRLPSPWDYENLSPAAVEEYRVLPAQDRYRRDVRVLYTYRRLGQTNPVNIAIGTPRTVRRVTIVLARYANPGAPRPGAGPRPVPDAVAALWPHVRFDWMFDRSLNQNYLGRTERDRDGYSNDARGVIEALVAHSTVVTWSHHGDPVPLLQSLHDLGSRK